MKEDDSAREIASCTNCYDANLKVSSLQDELESLKTVNKRLQQKVNALSNQLLHEKNRGKPFSCKDIKSDVKMKFYTGIQTLAIFNVIFDFIKPCLSSMVYWRGNNNTVSPSKYISHKKKRDQNVPVKYQFLLVLMRFRLGLMNVDLADRFMISPYTQTYLQHGSRCLDHYLEMH